MPNPDFFSAKNDHTKVSFKNGGGSIVSEYYFENVKEYIFLNLYLTFWLLFIFIFFFFVKRKSKEMCN